MRCACVILPAVLLLSFLVGCTRSPRIVVGSKNFTEQVILGEIAAQQLERKLHVKVERQLNLGGTLLAHQALVSGEIDVYPEYTGTALTSVLKEPPDRDAKAVFDKVARLYHQRFNLTWLPPLGFNDTFAMVIRVADAGSLTAKTLSVASRQSWRLGVGYEFLTRPDGYRRLNETYQFQWRDRPKTMDLGLLYRALVQNEIDMAAANSTDGLLVSNEFAVLEDDRHAFPPYQACFVIHEKLSEAGGPFPEARRALEDLSGSLAEETMRALNRRVDHDHEPVPQVAADFLKSLPPQVH